jgi:hypothetical protein
MNSDDLNSDANGISINGKTFADSFLASCGIACSDPETVSLPLNLDRRYRILKARFGISDNSPSSTRASSIEVIADGVVIYNRSFSLGQSQNVRLNVAGVLRLTFQFMGPLQTVYPAVGEPTVYK